MSKAFHADIFYDHARFLAQLLVVPDLKEQATQFAATFNTYRGQTNFDVTQFNNIVWTFREFKLSLLDRQKVMFIGPIFPSFVKHMITELDYLQSNVELSSPEEAKFWLEHDIGAMKLTAHLLDPEEVERIIKISKSVEKFQEAIADIEKDEERSKVIQDIILSINLMDNFEVDTRALIRGITSGTVESALSPELLAHEIKENTYGMLRVRSAMNRK